MKKPQPIRFIDEKSIVDKIMTDSIINARRGLVKEIDALILCDLKRMTDNGTLQLQMGQPQMKVTNNLNGPVCISMEQTGRLYFSGEETIKKLTEKVDAMMKILRMVDDSGCPDHIQQEIDNFFHEK